MQQSYCALAGALATAGVGDTVTLDRPLYDDVRAAAPDVVTTGVGVVVSEGSVAPGARAVVAGERRMLHHLASTADVEIPLRVFAVGDVPAEETQAALSRAALAVLVAVS